MAETSKLWASFVGLALLGLAVRLLFGGLIPEILALACWLAAIVIGAKLWRLSHPRALPDDKEAERIENEKLAQYGLLTPTDGR